MFHQTEYPQIYHQQWFFFHFFCCTYIHITTLCTLPIWGLPANIRLALFSLDLISVHGLAYSFIHSCIRLCSIFLRMLYLILFCGFKALLKRMIICKGIPYHFLIYHIYNCWGVWVKKHRSIDWPLRNREWQLTCSQEYWLFIYTFWRKMWVQVLIKPF